MGLWESIKNILTVPEEDGPEDEIEDIEKSEDAPAAPKKKTPAYEAAPAKRESSPRIIGGGRSKTVAFQQSQMQVVLVKPDRFEDVTEIADHLNDRKTVVLNLEISDRDTSRRILDFLSGAAYANNGNIRKVANSTYIIVPTDVDVKGDAVLDDFEEGKLYF